MTSTPDVPSRYSLVSLDTVGSTNDEAKRLAADGAADLTIVWAKEQTAGKGRLSRSWTSEPGNLYSSVIIRPGKPVSEAAQAGFLPALAVADLLRTSVESVDVRLKWPNDVLLNGKKIAGILVEAGPVVNGQPEFLIVGCGVNLAHYPDDTRFPAGSIIGETGLAIPPEAALEAYCLAFEDWYQRWLSNGYAPLRQAWLVDAHEIGDTLNVELGGKRTEGQFAGMSDDGALLLKTEDGVRTISAGDVYFADQG